MNIPRDNFNLLYATDEEIENRMNNAYHEWRIKVKKFEDIDVLFINTSYTWCDSLDKVCEILNIKPYEQKSIHKTSTLDNKRLKFYDEVHYIINLTILRKMRGLNKEKL